MEAKEKAYQCLLCPEPVEQLLSLCPKCREVIERKRSEKNDGGEGGVTA